MSTGTAFHERTGPLNRKMQWREWAGYWSAISYADHLDIEYNAIRVAAALIDVSPLYKYMVTGPDAGQLIDRVVVRNALKLAVGQVYYTCWCDEDGKVVDDGTITRLSETTYRWTAADPTLRWIRLNATGLDADVQEVTETTAAVALQGPLSRAVLEAAAGESFADLRYFRGRPATLGGVELYVTRTGYTGDLGYELWIEAQDAVRAWDHLMEVGGAFGLRPAGLNALDLVRLEAGLILLEVDYTSSRHAVIPEQAYSPFEIGLGRLVDFEKPAPFVGRLALEQERDAGGAPRRLVGLEIDWTGVERLYQDQGLFPVFEGAAWRTHVPVFSGSRQVGRATSGTWSPILKKNIALAQIEAERAEPGTRLEIEWTVEARRGRAAAIVTALPFFDPPRKRA
ncbi:MAG: aminomethyltransferase family protein [Actinomycetota bacterium]|nr:aminomethyltransferase family protein [Actinomycetota bacterium]